MCHFFGNPLFVLLSHKAVGKFYCRVSFLSIPVRALSWACAYEGLQVEEIQTMPGKETDTGIPYCWWFGNLLPNHLGNGAKTSVNHGGFLPQLPFYSTGFTVAGFLVAINSIEGIHPFLGQSQPSNNFHDEKSWVLQPCSRSCFHTIWGVYIRRWWFQIFLFLPLPGEMIKFESYFSNGLVQPPTRYYPFLGLVVFVYLQTDLF